jgi:hypothetical protein
VIRLAFGLEHLHTPRADRLLIAGCERFRLDVGRESRQAHRAGADGCGMPDLRFAIGAVLAIALLVVAIFGLAATVRVAHHRSTTPDDPPWRTLAFPDPTDWSAPPDRSRASTVAKTEMPQAPQAGVVTAADPETTATLKTREREMPQEMQAETEAKPEAAAGAAKQPTLDPPVTVPAAPLTAPTGSAMTPPRHEREPVDVVVAAIPETKAAPLQPTEMPPAIAVPTDDDQPPERSERVESLPRFQGHGFVPPEHPIAVPLPPSKPAIKKPPKKRWARMRLLRLLRAPSGYPLFGSHSKTGSDKTTGYDKYRTVE